METHREIAGQTAPQVRPEGKTPFLKGLCPIPQENDAFCLHVETGCNSLHILIYITVVF